MLEWRAAVIERLLALKLHVHEDRPTVFPVKAGLVFLGFRLERHRARLKRDAARRFRRRLRERQQQYAWGRIDFRALQASVTSLVAHASWGDTGGLRRRVLESMVFSRGAGSGSPASFAVAAGTSTASTRDVPTAT
jgi:hypothetical protein